MICSPADPCARLLAAGRPVHGHDLLAVLRRREYEAECDVGPVAAVGVHVDPVDRVGVEGVGLGAEVRVGVHDQDAAIIARRGEREHVAQIESCVACG
jgi:hypothetical protein